MTVTELLLTLFALVFAALLSACLTWVVRPVLLRHALATPNIRSSHRIPTPQGGGIAVVAATLVGAALAVGYNSGSINSGLPTALFAATLFMALVGIADDVKSIPVLPRLLLQGLAIVAVVLTAPHDLRIVPACPLWIERGLVLIAGLWFVNLCIVLPLAYLAATTSSGPWLCAGLVAVESGAVLLIRGRSGHRRLKTQRAS